MFPEFTDLTRLKDDEYDEEMRLKNLDVVHDTPLTTEGSDADPLYEDEDTDPVTTFSSVSNSLHDWCAQAFDQAKVYFYIVFHQIAAYFDSFTQGNRHY